MSPSKERKGICEVRSDLVAPLRPLAYSEQDGKHFRMLSREEACLTFCFEMFTLSIVKSGSIKSVRRLRVPARNGGS